jgi:hypothetical protein
MRLLIAGLVVALLLVTCPVAAEQRADYPLTLKVVRTNSQPFTTTSHGGSQTNCTFTDTYGNCHTYNSDLTWRHVQNTMLVEASDGKEYTIGCTASVRWSKCVWLQVGSTFKARWEKHGLAVLYHDNKGKEHEQVYSILSSAELPKPTEPIEQVHGAVPMSTPERKPASCHISSSPPGADIRVDGAFVGNTPSTLALAAGTHKGVVTAAGFTTWEREVSVTEGSEISIVADMEKQN